MFTKTKTATHSGVNHKQTHNPIGDTMSAHHQENVGPAESLTPDNAAS